MNNYICINGKKAELTEEQMKALGIELPKESPFEVKGNCEDPYWFITSIGSVVEATSHVNRCERFAVANYCTDKAIMEQRALHEILNRLLWRYAMEHGGTGDAVICYDDDKREFKTQVTCFKYFEPSFVKVEIAKEAIKEIIEPFMKAHPEFKW